MAAPELKRILYAEDEPDIQAVAKLALETIGGFELKICNNGKEVLESGNDFDADLILLDAMMPGMDGPTTLQELKKTESLSKIPVIFITAKVQPSEVAQLKELGAADVIPKPFDPMTLSQNILNIWQKLNSR